MTSLPSNLSQPALRALSNAGLHTVEQALALSDKELLKLHGFGPKGLRILKEQASAQNPPPNKFSPTNRYISTKKSSSKS